MNAQRSNFATNYRMAVKSLLDARETLKRLREADAAAGFVAAMTQDDLSGDNDHLTPADFTAAFGAMDSLESLLTDFTAAPPAPTAALAALVKIPR